MTGIWDKQPIDPAAKVARLRGQAEALLEVATTPGEKIRAHDTIWLIDWLQGTGVLDGATEVGPPNTWPANAGEFAARWNAASPGARDERTRLIVQDSERAIRCIEFGHDEQITKLSEQLGQASTTGAGMIAAERARQVIEEGYTAELDREQGDLLLRAGLSYAQNTLSQLLGGETIPRGNAPLRWSWPWSNVFWKPTGDPRRDLTKAGALIAAAIDALDAPTSEGESQ